MEIDREVQENGQNADNYPRMWALIADKGYQGVSDIFSGIK